MEAAPITTVRFAGAVLAFINFQARNERDIARNPNFPSKQRCAREADDSHDVGPGLEIGTTAEPPGGGGWGRSAIWSLSVQST